MRVPLTHIRFLSEYCKIMLKLPMFYWRNQFLISDINVANKAYDL